MEPIPVFLIDSNTTFLRIATRLLLEYYQQHMHVVGSTAQYDEALQQAATLKPRVILLGVGQHSLESLQHIPSLREILPRICIIVLGSLDIDIYRQAALDAGADDFVPKAAINHALLPAIQQCINKGQSSRERFA
jgi:DNA-binding NarL/FixJ family response regulator